MLWTWTCDNLEGGQFTVDKFYLSFVSGGDLSLPAETFGQPAAAAAELVKKQEGIGERGEREESAGMTIWLSDPEAVHCIVKQKSETRSEVEYRI